MLGSTIIRGVGVEYFWGRYIVSRGIEGLSVVTNRIERKDYRKFTACELSRDGNAKENFYLKINIFLWLEFRE